MPKGAVRIRVASPHSRFVALDIKRKNRVIAEGRTAESVCRKAQKSGKAFSVMYLPVPGKTYIY